MTRISPPIPLQKTVNTFSPQNLSQDPDVRILEYLRHFVVLHWTDIPANDSGRAKYGGPRTHNVSGFVMAVQDHWFWVTAGHIIEGLNRLRDEGREIRNLAFVDGLGTRNRSQTKIPFPLELPIRTFVNDEETGADFAVVPISNLLRSLMEVNGVVALDEGKWKHVLDIHAVQNCEMLGIPLETTTETLSYSLLRPCLAPIAHDPSLILDTINRLPRFAGKLIDKFPDGSPDALALDDINGMSGAPIFLVYSHADGSLDYALCAIQSGWLTSQRTVLGSFAVQVGEILERCLKKAGIKLGT